MTATGTGSPNKLRSSNFKTPTRGGATSNTKNGLFDSNADFGSLNNDDSMMKSSAMMYDYNNP
jgi:hypothetical protein